MSKNLLSTPIFISALITGLFLRLYLAWSYHGNFDQDSYDIVRELVLNDKNPYAYTARYNYSPLWFWILDFLGNLNYVFGGEFSVWVRSFLTLVDVATAFLIYQLTTHNLRLNPRFTTLVFWLSPVSILITGYHGQFDNLAILFLLCGLWAGWQWKQRAVFAIGASGVAAILAKHSVFLWAPFVLARRPQKLIIRLGWWGLTLLIFLLSFVPYWNEGQEGIRNNVFAYSGIRGYFGINSFFYPLLLTPTITLMLKLLLVFLTIAAIIFLEPRYCKDDRENFRNAARYLLLPSLIFLAFAPGFGLQYLLFPIAVAALQPSLPFAIYSVLTTFWLLGSSDNVNIPAFRFFRDGLASNTVYISLIIWLAFEVVGAWHARQHSSSTRPVAGDAV